MNPFIRRALFGFLIATGLLFSNHKIIAQSSLSEITTDIRTPPAPVKNAAGQKKRNRKNERQVQAGSYEESDPELFGFLGKAILLGIGVPFWGPPYKLQDDYLTPGYFSAYPYQHDLEGYMMIDPCLPNEPQPWSLQASSEYADDFGGISRIGTHLRIDTTLRFGLDAEFNQWREGLPGGGHDELWTGDVNLLFRFAQSSEVQMRTGFGTTWIADDGESDFGFNFTYQGDFMPMKPWVISAEIDLGKIADESLFHARITTGLQWRRSEVFVGYDHYQVGHTELTGFLGGLRLSF